MTDPYAASRRELRAIGAGVRRVIGTLQASGVSVVPAEPPRLIEENDDNQAEQ